MKKKISLSDVKKALKDSRFRESLPKGLEHEINKYLSNPGCACNVPIYRKILQEGREQLLAYFPESEISEDDEIARLAENHWVVINCHVDELEEKLRKLGPGRKQLDVARYEDQVTAVVNELDLVY